MSSTGIEQSTTLSLTVRTFEEFAVADIFSGDIDPTYWAIHRAYDEYGPDWAKRFCVAMLCYYHTGTAVQAAEFEGEQFWLYLIDIYPTAPRASERRHFRGAAGLNALNHMRSRFPNPTTFFDSIPRHYGGLMSYCGAALKQFGPYFQLKIADYMDRCLRMPIDQPSMNWLYSGLPTLPAKALKMLYPTAGVRDAFEDLRARLRPLELLAPPAFDRPIGPAEIETILCDWKRAKTGSSWIGADVLDKRNSFWYCGEKAQRMSEWMPPNIERSFKLELL
jgi:hypothetical protein